MSFVLLFSVISCIWCKYLLQSLFKANAYFSFSRFIFDHCITLCLFISLSLCRSVLLSLCCHVVLLFHCSAFLSFVFSSCCLSIVFLSCLSVDPLFCRSVVLLFCCSVVLSFYCSVFFSYPFSSSQFIKGRPRFLPHRCLNQVLPFLQTSNNTRAMNNRPNQCTIVQSFDNRSTSVLWYIEQDR